MKQLLNRIPVNSLFQGGAMFQSVFARRIESFLFVSIFLSYSSVFAQKYGTVNLPRSLADSGVPIQRAATSTPKLNLWGEGPAVAQNGNLFFSEQIAGNIWKVTPAGEMDTLVKISSYSNGLDFNPVNRHLVVCEKSQITERDTGTGAITKVITHDTGTAWTAGNSGGANDLTFANNGDLFFTCWNQHIYFHSHDSSVNKDYNFSTSYGTCQWNGIEYIEEKGFMYVCQYGKNRVVTFKVNPATHLIDTSAMKQFGPTIFSPDGITVDSNYNVYVCNNSSTGTYANAVVVLDSTGAVLGSIKMTQTSSSAAVNCVFGNSMFGGGPNPHMFYITGDSGAFKVQLKVAGRVHPGITAIRQGRAGIQNITADRRAISQILLGKSRSSGGSAMNGGTPSLLYDLKGKKVILGHASSANAISSALYIGENRKKNQ